ncbi:11695_t:CDS:2, partial [Entrophospora sp. SA101]
MKKTLTNFLLTQLLLVILIANSLLINADQLNYKAERDHSTVRNIIVGSFTGGWSHLRPLLDISKILVERGYNVTLLSPGSYSSKPEYEKIKHYSIGTNTIDARKQFEKIVYGKATSSFISAVIKTISDRYLNQHYVYERVSNEVKPDLFLCDFVNNEVCFDMAWKLKKPMVSLGVGLTILEQPPYKSDPLFGCHVNMENESFLERLRCFLTPKVIMALSSLPEISKINEIRAKVGIAPTDLYERTKENLYLSDTFSGFDVPFPSSPILQEIGPIMSDSYPPLSPETKKFLDNHPRTMLVAFGTQFYVSERNNGILLQSFIEAIENNVLDGVIWGLSNIILEEIPKTITLSNGKEFDTIDIINNKHPNIHILSFAPQFSILAHENCKVFLSHTGASSANEALYNGKPILALPIALDQHGNAEKLEKFAGVALTLDKMTLNVEEILIKLQRLLREEKFKINGEKMKFLARINSKRKHRAADLIEYTIQAHESKEKLNRNYLDVYLALLSIVLVTLVISVFTIYKLTSLIVAKFLINL